MVYTLNDSYHLFIQSKKEMDEERKLSQKQKDQLKSDMKSFFARQKKDYVLAMNAFKEKLKKDVGLSNTQQKQFSDDKKKELVQQQKVNEEEHLQKLKEVAGKALLVFKQKIMQERQSFESELLQKVS